MKPEHLRDAEKSLMRWKEARIAVRNFHAQSQTQQAQMSQIRLWDTVIIIPSDVVMLELQRRVVEARMKCQALGLEMPAEEDPS